MQPGDTEDTVCGKEKGLQVLLQVKKPLEAPGQKVPQPEPAALSGAMGFGHGNVLQKGPCPPKGSVPSCPRARGADEAPLQPAGCLQLGAFALGPNSFVFVLRSGQKVRNLLVGFFSP